MKTPGPKSNRQSSRKAPAARRRGTPGPSGGESNLRPTSGSGPAPSRVPIIFVVDDDPGLLILIESVLSAENWKVAYVSSGAEALAWLQTNSADLLLLDLKLSDIEGREFVRALADGGRSVPFIVITGQGDERVAVEMMQRGALDYLVKDVNFVELVPTVVRRAMERLAAETRLAEAEEALRRSEAMLARAQELAHVGGCEINVAGTSGNYWSDECFRILGLDPGLKAEVTCEYLLHCVHPEERARVREALDRCRNQRIRFDIEYRIVRPDRSIRHVHSIVEPVLGSGDQVAKLVGTMQDITDRKRMEREILEISEREQRKFGQDLHDGLGQRLTALEMLSHGLAEDLKDHAPAMVKQARRLNRELRETVTQARLISHSLAPVPLEGDGLIRGLTELAGSTNRIPGVRCHFTGHARLGIHDVTTATHLYRIAQEAVNNALKHGHAKQVDIALTEGVDGLELVVENNGRALPPNCGPNQGVGLNVMRYRAAMIGATLAIESGTRKGVRVICTLGRRP